MVDVSEKPVTVRTARAEGFVSASQEALSLARQGDAKKGDVCRIAEIAGIMAAKRTSELIPLCHLLALSSVKVAITIEANGFRVVTDVTTTGQTGVEMEALTAASVACLTLYDMLKAVDRGMVIDGIRLLQKSGGQSGDYTADVPGR
jgi:cyclic pyranopterin monophosphate synthase